jgi:hypothetical protein
MREFGDGPYWAQVSPDQEPEVALCRRGLCAARHTGWRGRGIGSIRFSIGKEARAVETEPGAVPNRGHDTLMLQQVLARPQWSGKPTGRGALTPLIWEHVNPYPALVAIFETRLLDPFCRIIR